MALMPPHLVRRTLITLTAILMLGATRPGLAQDDADSAALRAAVTALHGHLAGNGELDAAQIDAHTATVKQQARLIAADRELLETAMALVSRYETGPGPLWVRYLELTNKKRVEGDAIHWAAFWVMQSLLDHAYTAENLARYGELLDGFRFAAAAYFPGQVEPPADPAARYSVQINGSYPETWGAPILGQDLPARKPTGAYLAPGSIATVTVPESLVGQGYQIRVGAHSWDLQKKPRIKRLFRVSTVYDITATETQVANPLGGGIYIEVPYQADAGVVTVTVRNALRSPYYSAKPFHQTSLQQWQETERHHPGPWADFQSEAFMMQVPSDWIRKLEDPVTLIQDWDAAMDVMNELMGMPRRHGRESLYTQVDTQLRGRAFHPGYPSVNMGYDPARDYGGSHDTHLLTGPRDAPSHEFHEMGHGYLFTKYAGGREAAVNLHHVAVMNRAFGIDLQEAFRGSRGTTNTFQTLDTTAVTWMMSDSFIEQTGMKNYERQYQLKGHAKYVDIARLFGWESLDRFWHSTQQDYMDGNPWDRDMKDYDAYTQRLSESAGADLRPLLHVWGILTQDDDASDAAIAAAGLKPSAAIYDTLVRYQSLIPADNAAFREFARAWWEKQPSPDGFTTERNHARRWDSYDADEAARTRAVVQQIIDRYFPDGRPAD